MKLFTFIISMFLIYAFASHEKVDSKTAQINDLNEMNILNHETNIDELNNNEKTIEKNNFYGSTTWYFKKNGRKYKICQDQDGIRVKLPNGNHHSYGTGWTLKEVKRSHGLSGIKPYSRSSSSFDCD